MREALTVVALAVNCRSTIINEMLVAEASKYDFPIYMGTRDFFSSPSSFSFGLALMAGRSFGLGGLVAMEGEVNQDPLRIILVDGSSLVIALGEKKALVEVGVGDIEERSVNEGSL